MWSLLLCFFHSILPSFIPRRIPAPTPGRHRNVSTASANPAGGIPERSPVHQPRPPWLRNAARAHARPRGQSARSQAPRSPVLIRVSASLSQWWTFTASEGGAKPSLTWGLGSLRALSGNRDLSAEKRDRSKVSSVWERIDGFDMKQLPPPEATEVQADSPVGAAVVNTLQKREVPVVTWGMRPPMRSRGRG